MVSNCERAQQLISKALLDELGDAEKQELKFHVPDCHSCTEEQQRYADTVERLRTASTVDIPRHFFVYADPQRNWKSKLGAVFSHPWRLGAAAVILLVLVIGAAALFRLQVRVEHGVFTVGFGQSLSTRSTSASEQTPGLTPKLREELIQVIDERSDRKLAELMVAMRAELRRTQDSSTRRQRRQWELLLSGLETRVKHRWDEQRAGLQTEVNQSMARLYHTLQAQREQDLSLIQVRMNRMAADGLMKDKETEEILSTLLQVAEVK